MSFVAILVILGKITQILLILVTLVNALLIPLIMLYGIRVAKMKISEHIISKANEKVEKIYS